MTEGKTPFELRHKSNAFRNKKRFERMRDPSLLAGSWQVAAFCPCPSEKAGSTRPAADERRPMPLNSAKATTTRSGNTFTVNSEDAEELGWQRLRNSACCSRTFTLGRSPSGPIFFCSRGCQQSDHQPLRAVDTQVLLVAKENPQSRQLPFLVLCFLGGGTKDE